MTKRKSFVIRVNRVKLDRDGYDRGGQYFGVGAKLWSCYAVDSKGYTIDNSEQYLRAPSLAQARKLFQAYMEGLIFALERFKK